MANLRDWVPGERLQVLVYGRSGSGKTWGAGTWPRPLFMDFDHGIATLAGPEFVAKWGRRHIEYQQFTERSFGKGGIVAAHNAFDDAFFFFEKMMKPEHRDTFDTWVIDSGTTLSEVAANKALIVMGLMKLSKTYEMGKSMGLLAPKQQDYGAERSLVEQFVRMVKSADKHFVMLCHERTFTSDDGTITAIAPLLTGKSVEEIPLMFDEVYNLRVVRRGTEWKHLLRTHPDQIVKAKTRYGVPDDTEWNYPDILDALNRNRQATGSGALTAATR